MPRNSRIIGASRLKRKLKRMPDEIQDQLRGTIQRAADEVLYHQIAYAPESDDPAPVDWMGRPRLKLRQALSVKINKDGMRAQIGIIGKRASEVFFFARFFEFGARPGRKRSGDTITAHRNRLSSERPKGGKGDGYIRQPFISRAFFVTRDKIRRNIRAASLRALQVVVRSNPGD